MRSVILGTGMYVPPHVVTNERLSRIMDTSDEWIRQRTGIRERRYSAPGQATSDLAVPAAAEALAAAGVAKDEVDYVVFATMNPDHFFPGSGPLFQTKAGLPPVPCLDIRQQCAGFIYGLQVADALLKSRIARRVLVVGAEVHMGLMPWRSWDVLLDDVDREIDPKEYELNTSVRDRAVLFGDGAGAAVLALEEAGERGILDAEMHTDGAYAELMWVPGGGSASRPYFDPEMYRRGETLPIVEGREVFKLAVASLPQAITSILERNGFTIDDLDLLVMHQANLRINEAVQKRLELPDERVFNNIDRYGNTTAATIPMAFHEAKRAGHGKPGDLVCFVGLGSGLNWGTVLYRC